MLVPMTKVLLLRCVLDLFRYTHTDAQIYTYTDILAQLVFPEIILCWLRGKLSRIILKKSLNLDYFLKLSVSKFLFFSKDDSKIQGYVVFTLYLIFNSF